MIDAQTYLEHIRRDGERIARVAEGNLDKQVPSCPGNTVESLLMHVTGVLLFWTEALKQKARPELEWGDLGKDMLAAYERQLGLFLVELSSRDPDDVTWTWGSDQHVRFWYRRAAQELSIHRWDFENAVGAPLPIDPTLAADGVDELLEEFAPKPERYPVKSASQMFDGDGQKLRFEATDAPVGWTITAWPERFDISPDGNADVTARSTASDLNLFVWGRVGPEALAVSGDRSLIERWQDRVKI